LAADDLFVGEAEISSLQDFGLARFARRADILINFTPGLTATSGTQATIPPKRQSILGQIYCRPLSGHPAPVDNFKKQIREPCYG